MTSNVNSGSLKFISMDESQLFGIIIAVAVVIITLVIIALWRRTKNARKGVIVLGLCDSGKTLIYSRLLHGKYVMTQTSIKDNVGSYETKKGPLRVIDIPGHERVRFRFFDSYKASCHAVMFVIDSVTFQKEIRDVAEFLYIVLTDPSLASRKTNLLIVCNKQDQTMAKGSKVIKVLLEKELNILRSTKTHQLSSIEGSSNSFQLGRKNEDFEFGQSLFDVEFCEAYAVNENPNDEPDLGGVEKWLNTLV